MTRRIAIFLTSVFLFQFPALVFAQANSWTNPTSGNWQDPYWSLGVLPGTNQTILFTNEGVKVLTIGANTAENFPETMNVDSITVSSPPGSGNILLLNYAGFQTPLKARQMLIGSNSIVLMYSSILQMSGYSLFSIDGSFFQDVNSQVSANYGIYIGGSYNLLSGVLYSTDEAIDGLGTFTQSGGTNKSGVVLNIGLSADTPAVEAPEYNLNGGEFDGPITIRNGGAFNQNGGIANATNGLQIDGNFVLSGGIFNGPVQLPATLEEVPTYANALQTGGTNQGSLVLGLPFPAEIYAGYNNQLEYYNCQDTPDYGGTYTLSNGVLISSGTSITANGAIEQVGGVDIVNGTLSLEGTLYYTYYWTCEGGCDHWFVGCAKAATYSLTGGSLSVTDLNIGAVGDMNQSGGTNVIFGNLTLSGPASPYGAAYFGNYDLSGGLLAASNISIGSGKFSQSGGHLVVGNLSGFFTQTGGNITQSGLLALGSGIQVAAGNQQFGQLQLDNSSILTLPSGACLIQFADSSAIAWSTNTQLLIQNWSGSQQIIFGSNSAALTPQQVSQIQFQNPAGLAPGTYPARILATGEIVPMLPLKLQIGGSLSNGAISLQVQGDIGQNYEVDVSTDLVNWSSWTTVSNSTGTISLSDSEATNFPQRFYRVRLIP